MAAVAGSPASGSSATGTLFLIPGDAPIGFRLPLDSLPWADPNSIEYDQPADPFAPAPALPPRQRCIASPAPSRRTESAPAARRTAMPAAPQRLPEIGREEPDLVRTALAVEASGGRLHVFFPPLYAAEDWLDLAAAVEATAAELGMQVVLEGYPPPRDPRLNQFSVTPDPGVIEVNIHPARALGRSWSSAPTQLYEAARQEGLATEKFMLDGRHTGTGGGNHVVLGGATPADSPFLRRPDLLKPARLLAQPSERCRYLFSGLFIGPTSQHPRIDEARTTASTSWRSPSRRSPPGKGAPETPPWLTDRLFRNILADITGNTHRTEFCIDKMYAPENHRPARPGGVPRLRDAARMLGCRSRRCCSCAPPSPRSGQSPYERTLVRWGTRLHDDFMLPHYVGQDFNAALEELSQLGFPLDRSWFAPHLEFRFPKIGDVGIDGTTLELRHALEPWHVLGEEPASGGTVRYVDSSTERVQARVTGWVDERYVLSCNGAGVPLSQTQTAGEYVGAVRFKAWAPPSALHPTVRAQSPLVFDIYDRWNGRSLGGLTHHVSHPGGRSYDTFPVNANEAEARRRARFLPFGHTPGPMPEPSVTIGKEHPRTLDLRR
jgi:uncharacterized protein (DUF2126 family)